MTKKELENRILALEKELGELKSQMLSLALRPMAPYPVYIPNPQPAYIERQIPWGPPNYPIITCGSGQFQ